MLKKLLLLLPLLALLPSEASASNCFYTSWKAKLLTGSDDMSSVTVKVQPVTSGYSVNCSTHDFFDDVASGNRVCTPVALASKTTTSGVFSSAATTYTACTGSAIVAYVIYIDTGTESTSRLIAYIDTAASGLPVTPNGGNITITPHASNGWFYFSFLLEDEPPGEMLAANDDDELERYLRAS
jgi:hypothetical protein